MPLNRWALVAVLAAVVACAHAKTNVRPPLAAALSPGARTGAPVPLRRDPNAKVILSSAAGLPPASYLPAQAARGEQIYSQTCSVCHELGALVGQGFVESWNDRRVYDLFALIRGTMPLDKPGGMKDQEYLDVVAYLLKANHHVSAGTDSLAADTLALRK